MSNAMIVAPPPDAVATGAIVLNNQHQRSHIFLVGLLTFGSSYLLVAPSRPDGQDALIHQADEDSVPFSEHQLEQLTFHDRPV